MGELYAGSCGADEREFRVSAGTVETGHRVKKLHRIFTVPWTPSTRDTWYVVASFYSQKCTTLLLLYSLVAQGF